MRMRKKGQNLLAGAMATIFGLFMIGILLAAFVLAQTSFRTSITDSDAELVINDSIAAADSYSGLQTAIWIIAAIALLIGVLLTGIGGYFLLNRG